MYEPYKETLDTWIKKTGKTQKELAAFSNAFFSLEKPLAEAQVTNAKKVPPSREDGRRNLYILMGLLHACDVISEADSKKFLEDYDITYEEDGTWEDIWSRISAGAQTVRTKINQAEIPETPEKRKSPTHTLTVISRRGVWIKVAMLVGILGAMFGVAGILSTVLTTRTQNWCVTSPVEVQQVGEITRFYVSADIRLDNFEEFPFYIYFNGEYVRKGEIDLEGLERAENRWSVTIHPSWIDTHPAWFERELWRIAYVC